MDDQPPKPVCLDASLATALALPEDLSMVADQLWQQWVADERSIVVPPHFGAELISAVRRAAVGGRLTAEQQAKGTDICFRTVLRYVEGRWPSTPLWERAWAWSERLRRPNVFDSLYLAVAEEVGAEFWTADGNLVRALEADGKPRPDWVHLVEP